MVLDICNFSICFQKLSEGLRMTSYSWAKSLEEDWQHVKSIYKPMKAPVHDPSLPCVLFLCVSSSLCFLYRPSSTSASVCVTCPILRLILPVLTFLPGQWKADDGSPSGITQECPQCPMCPYTTFSAGSEPPRCGSETTIGSILGNLCGFAAVLEEIHGDSMDLHRVISWFIFGVRKFPIHRQRRLIWEASAK